MLQVSASIRQGAQGVMVGRAAYNKYVLFLLFVFELANCYWQGSKGASEGKNLQERA